MVQLRNDTDHARPLVVDGEGSRQRRGALWLQFPRRAILLIAACTIAIFLLRLWPIAADPLDTPAPPADGLLVNALALQRLPASLMLLILAMALAFVLALLFAAVATLVSVLEARAPRVGSLLAALGRLALFSWMPLPLVVSAFLLLLLLVTTGVTPGPLLAPAADSPFTLLVGALLLALYPALLAAQDAAQIAAAQPPPSRGRRLPAALLQLGQSVLLQTAGFLSGLTVIELIFARPGLGRLLVDSVFRRDFDIMVDVLTLMAMLVLLGRLTAELLGWARRFVLGDTKELLVTEQPAPRRRWWTLLAVLLLLLPLILVVLGLLADPATALQQDLQQRLAAPSPQHPLGTDALGRDNWARLRLGSLGTLARASLVGGAVLLPALILGLLAGTLFNRDGWLRESLADAMFLPLDALLFLPLVPAAIAFVALSDPGANIGLVLALALLFLPRAARAGRDSWRYRRAGSRGARDALSTLVSLFLLALFNAFVVLLAVEYLGFGPQPPAASLGLLLQESQQHLLAAPAPAAAVLVVLAVLAFALYTAAAAVSDFVDSQRPLVRFNE